MLNKISLFIYGIHDTQLRVQVTLSESWTHNR
jgi:hypothetical protein